MLSLLRLFRKEQTVSEYNTSTDCIANRLVRDVLGMHVKWFNSETGRWRLGTIFRIERSCLHIRAKDRTIQSVQWGFVILPEEND